MKCRSFRMERLFYSSKLKHAVTPGRSLERDDRLYLPRPFFDTPLSAGQRCGQRRGQSSLPN